jgi:hypothetical protein
MTPTATINKTITMVARGGGAAAESNRGNGIGNGNRQQNKAATTMTTNMTPMLGSPVRP